MHATITRENLNALKSEHKDLKTQSMQNDKAISKSKQEFLKEFDEKTKLQIRIKFLDELANEKKRESLKTGYNVQNDRANLTSAAVSETQHPIQESRSKDNSETHAAYG